ncbi:MAG TPA: MARVEL domain-containing protein [bacterium]|jgi:hypothetical protein
MSVLPIKKVKIHLNREGEDLEFKESNQTMYFRKDEVDDAIKYSKAVHEILKPHYQTFVKLREAYVRKEVSLGVLGMITGANLKQVPYGTSGCLFWVIATFIISFMVTMFVILQFMTWHIHPMITAVFDAVVIIFWLIRVKQAEKWVRKAEYPNNSRLDFIKFVNEFDSIADPRAETFMITDVYENPFGGYKVHFEDIRLNITDEVHEKYLNAGSPKQFFLVVDGVEILDEDEKRVEPGKVVEQLRKMDSTAEVILKNI